MATKFWRKRLIGTPWCWKQKKRRTLSHMSHNAVNSNIPTHCLKCSAHLPFIPERACSCFHLCGSWQKHSEGRHFVLWCDDNWGVSVGVDPESLPLVCVGINMFTAGTDVSVGLVSMQKNRWSIHYSFLIWTSYFEVIHMCVTQPQMTHTKWPI